MAGEKIRRPPLPAGDEDVRELDAWRNQLYRMLSLVGTGTVNPGLIGAGAIATATVTVTGAMAGMTVHLGPPAAIEAGLLWNGLVSATNVVTIRLYNSTGAGITPASATWTARVMP